MSKSPVPTPGGSDVTALLAEASGGNREAFDRLVPLVYEELKQQAAARLRLERDGHTLNATALVHEAYVRLVGQEHVEWKGRAHFFAVAAQAMRRILMNHAEARNAGKRRGKAVHIDLDEIAHFVTDERAGELIAVDEALRELEAFNERGARVVEYRFFGGLTNDEIAEVMGLSDATVRRSWRAARAWLRASMANSPAKEA
jgi:RNA polymerase sigma factor (TIGR02999 family)